MLLFMDVRLIYQPFVGQLRFALDQPLAVICNNFGRCCPEARVSDQKMLAWVREGDCKQFGGLVGGENEKTSL